MNGANSLRTVEVCTSEAFPKRRRLLARRDFRTTLRRGRVFRNGGVLMAVKRTPLGFSRLGISVGKEVGGAVARNRAKRCVREAFRRRADMHRAGVDVVVVLRSSEAGRGLSDVINDLFGELSKLC